MPDNLTFSGPVTLHPFQPEAVLAQDASDFPMLASNLMILPQTAITLTFPVTINENIPARSKIRNTAAITSTEMTTPHSGSVTIRVICRPVAVVLNTDDSGSGSLRQAIIDVCHDGDINFSVSTPATITLTNGELAITKTLNINGPGVNELTISGNETSRVFKVSGEVYMTGLTIRDGLFGNGDGIYNTGVLTVNDCAILANGHTGIYNLSGTIMMSNCTVAENGGGIANFSGMVMINNTSLSNNHAMWGGAIYNANGIFTLNNSTVSNNVAVDSGGGGIANSGVLTISESTLSNNVADSSGGAIYNFQGSLGFRGDPVCGFEVEALAGFFGYVPAKASTPREFPEIHNLLGTTTIINSTISDNWAQRGGGIANNEGTVVIRDSTLSNNTGLYNADGIYNYSYSTMTIDHSTLSGNSAGSNGNIYNGLNGTVMVNDSIITNSPGGDDCSGVIDSLGHNLDSDGTCNLTGPGDLPNTDPLLGQLEDNGGATLTHALLPGSPAIDAGDNDNCPATDQRGVARPKGAGCDIGAYEREPIVLRLDYQYGANDGSTGTGRYTLLADNTFVDEQNSSGVWQYQPTPSPRLVLQYSPGFACNALSIGNFTGPGQVQGWRLCRDGSGVIGLWIGTVAGGAFDRLLTE